MGCQGARRRRPRGRCPVAGAEAPAARVFCPHSEKHCAGQERDTVEGNTAPKEPVGTLYAVVLDVDDLGRSGRFWSEVLGKDISFKADRYCRVGRGDDPPSLLLQKVPELHERKNRAHIDLDVADLAPAVQKVERLGGSRLAQHAEYGIIWAVMADPDGNEFCLVQHS